MKWIRKIGAATIVIGIGASIAYVTGAQGVQANMLGGLFGAGAMLCLMHL